ncbi:MAG: hypothetical protein M1557_02870, partial [Actinobacteria bacterium]|nr:hypothetical protein [Actinomycetota bacterium]
MAELPSLTRNDVFILGAGFSKAINEIMPLAGELLVPVLEQLGSDVEPPCGGEGFEQWLSRLAESQPYLSADENHIRAATFIKASRAIAEVLTTREQEALKIPLAEWFAKLLFSWHVRQATVITFNYDNLVECGVNSQDLPRSDRYPVTTGDVLRRLPPVPPQQQSQESEISTTVNGGVVSMAGESWHQLEPWEATFRLIKLHGSISWYWVPEDITGTTLQRWQDVGKFGSPVGEQSKVIRRHLPGRVPFIAPPSSTKSQYLSNPVIRELWTDAYRALRSAERIFILGYSLPLQDQAAMGLIVEGLGKRTPEIHVVNQSAQKVVGNLSSLLVPARGKDDRVPCTSESQQETELIGRYSLSVVSGDTSIMEAACGYFDELAADCAQNLTQYAQQQEKVNQVIDVSSTDARFRENPIVGQVHLGPGWSGSKIDVGGIRVDGDDVLIIPWITGVEFNTDNLALTKLVHQLQTHDIVSKIVLQKLGEPLSEWNL